MIRNIYEVNKNNNFHCIWIAESKLLKYFEMQLYRCTNIKSKTKLNSRQSQRRW